MAGNDGNIQQQHVLVTEGCYSSPGSLPTEGFDDARLWNPNCSSLSAAGPSESRHFRLTSLLFRSRQVRN